MKVLNPFLACGFVAKPCLVSKSVTLALGAAERREGGAADAGCRWSGQSSVYQVVGDLALPPRFHRCPIAHCPARVHQLRPL
jgi:hypothetical protein